MTATFDTVIVGGGIVGAACAVALARQGMRVAMVEQGEIGAGATAAAMGHVVVLDDSPAQLVLTRYSQKLWQEVGQDLPGEVEYTVRGTLWLASDEVERNEICRKYGAYREHGIRCQVVETDELQRIEPALRSGLAGALLVHEDLVVAPQMAARYFMGQALAVGVTLVRDHAKAMGSSVVLLRSGGELRAPILINAAGEWAAQLTPGLPVVQRKGHLAITEASPGFLHYQVVELGYLKSAAATMADTVAFNVQPKANGQLLVGSSRQYGAQGREVEPEILARIFACAAEYLPALPSLIVERAWTGFRSATPDKLPLIGRSAADPSLFLATGHEGLGITTSLATARLLADSIAGREPAIPLEPYAPNRTMSKIDGLIKLETGAHYGTCR